MDIDTVIRKEDKHNIKYQESRNKEIDYLNQIKNFNYNYDNNIDIIDNDIYQSLNIIKKSENKKISSLHNKNAEKEESLKDILLPLFPNEKVFYSEFNSDKIFLLDKFISKGREKKKKMQKNKEAKNEENEDELKLENSIKKQSKVYKKEKESSIINKLKSDKSLEYSSICSVMSPLWKSYLKMLLNKNQNIETIYSKMLKADLHGAIIQVCDSVNKNNIGIEGINLLETKRTFSLLNNKNEIKIILKKGTVFAIDITFAYDDGSQIKTDNKVANDVSDKLLIQSKIFNENVFQKEKNERLKFPLIIKIIGDNFMYKSSFRTKAKYKNRYVL